MDTPLNDEWTWKLAQLGTYTLSSGYLWLV